MVDDRELLVAEVSSNPYKKYDSTEATEEETDCADEDGLALKKDEASMEWVSLKVLTQTFGGGESCANMGGAAAVVFHPVSSLSLTSVSECWRWNKVEANGKSSSFLPCSLFLCLWRDTSHVPLTPIPTTDSRGRGERG